MQFIKAVGILAMAAAVVAPVLAVRQAADVQKILSDMRIALTQGGTIEAVKTLTAEGQIQRISARGSSEHDFELAVEFPDKYLLRRAIAETTSGSVHHSTGFSGDRLISFFEPTLSWRGVGSTEPSLAAQKQDFARLALGLVGSSFSGYPLAFSYSGQTETPNGRAVVLTLTGDGDFTARLLVDARTHLPMMVTWMALEPLVLSQRLNPDGRPPGAIGDGGARPLTAEQMQAALAAAQARRGAVEAQRKVVEYRDAYSNFKVAGGLKLPHTITRSIAGTTVEEMTFQRVKVNPKIDPRKFDGKK